MSYRSISRVKHWRDCIEDHSGKLLCQSGDVASRFWPGSMADIGSATADVGDVMLGVGPGSKRFR